jgi:hypothetical protein
MPTRAWVVIVLAALLVTPWPYFLYRATKRRTATPPPPRVHDTDFDARFTASNGFLCEVVQHGRELHLEVQFPDGLRGCVGRLPPAGQEVPTANVLRLIAAHSHVPGPRIATAEFLEHIAHENGTLR